MARMKAEIRSFADGVKFLNGERYRELGHNTWVERIGPDDIGIGYHRTIIVQHTRDGEWRFNGGGYLNHPTTYLRISKFAPNGWSLWKENHIVRLSGGSGRSVVASFFQLRWFRS